MRVVRNGGCRHVLHLEMAVQEMWTRALARNAPAVGERDGIEDVEIWVFRRACGGGCDSAEREREGRRTRKDRGKERREHLGLEKIEEMQVHTGVFSSKFRLFCHTHLSLHSLI